MKITHMSVVGGILAASLSWTPVLAADLGGDCCADLEERVAELEATTARKGNRKVSLTVTGWIAEQVMYYDNGAASNLYQTGVGSTLGTHFKFTGAAQINPDVSAGYVMQLELQTSDPLTAGNSRFGDDGPSGFHITQTNGGLASPSIDLLYSFWFLKSKKWGQVNVGQIPQASQHAAALVDGSGSLVQANWVPLDGMAINLSRNGTQLVLPNGTGFPTGAAMWCQSSALPVAGDCHGISMNGVRYDSPTFMGFSASASWGEDDVWDVALRYAGEMRDFRLAATAAYTENTDETHFQGFNTVTGLPQTVQMKGSYFQIGAYLQHMPSGLFLYGAYGVEDNDSVYITPLQTVRQPDGHNWYLKAGLRRKWFALGHTVLYGEYAKREDMFHPHLSDFIGPAGFVPDGVVDVTGSSLTQWGLGAVQEIDAAAMSVWVGYKNYDTSFEGPGVAGVLDDLDQLHIVKAGALIAF